MTSGLLAVIWHAFPWDGSRYVMSKVRPSKFSSVGNAPLVFQRRNRGTFSWGTWRHLCFRTLGFEGKWDKIRSFSANQNKSIRVRPFGSSQILARQQQLNRSLGPLCSLCGVLALKLKRHLKDQRLSEKGEITGKDQPYYIYIYYVHPPSNNHGSWADSPCRGQFVFQGPRFHFHDCFRESRPHEPCFGTAWMGPFQIFSERSRRTTRSCRHWPSWSRSWHPGGSDWVDNMWRRPHGRVTDGPLIQGHDVGMIHVWKHGLQRVDVDGEYTIHIIQDKSAVFFLEISISRSRPVRTMSTLLSGAIELPHGPRLSVTPFLQTERHVVGPNVWTKQIEQILSLAFEAPRSCY